MLTPNPYLENLLDGVVKERIIKTIHVNNEPFLIFEKKNIEYYGAYAEYIGDQPLEGVQWDKELTGEDFKKLPEVFSCILPIQVDKVYPSIQNKTVMKRALQSPALMAELSERLIDSMKTKATGDIKKKMLEIITTKENYKETTGWIEWDHDQLVIDSLDKAINIIDWIYTKSGEMLEESTHFNKGYQKPGSKDWHDVIVNSLNRKSLIIYFDTSIYNPIRVRFLADIQEGNHWVNLKADFGGVYEMKMPEGSKAKIIVRDINSLAYTIIAEEGINSEVIPASGSTKFYFHPTIIGGSIPFANAVALASK